MLFMSQFDLKLKAFHHFHMTWIRYENHDIYLYLFDFFLKKIPTILTKRHHQNITQSKKHSHQNSSLQSSQNSWHNENSKEKLTKIGDSVYNHTKNDSKIFSRIIIPSTKSNSVIFNDVKVIFFNILVFEMTFLK